jgi:hypothetical protein
MKKALLTFLLICHLLKELVWLGIIPIWHFPDEEQHFALTAFLAEKQYYPKNNEFDVSQEIDQSSEILGTKRNSLGINKFTYHPEYRIPYTKSQTGLYEEEIQDLNTKKNRQTMVKREAGLYGPIYYFLTTIPYKIFYQNDLFSRLFFSRFISVILSTITIYLIYLISKEIFKSQLLIFSTVFLVLFQPMFSFVSAGVNSDNLFNLIFSLILYSCLKIFFNKKVELKYLILLALAFVLGFYTKRQIIIALPVALFALLISFFKKRKKKTKRKPILIIGFLILAYLFLNKGKIGIPEYSFGSISLLKENFFQYIFWHLKHTIAETIPWYWGVFNWLGVVLPKWVYQVQARLLIVAAFGLAVYFFKQIKEKKIKKINNLKLIFLIGSAGIYYFSIITWDYFFRQVHPHSFGIQGRYFFPTIGAHMILMALGLISLVPKNHQAISLKILNSWWLVFSLIGLLTAINAYYQTWPIYTFLNQVSQYKPSVFKTNGIVVISFSYLLCLIFLLVKMFKINEKKN